MILLLFCGGCAASRLVADDPLETIIARLKGRGFERLEAAEVPVLFAGERSAEIKLADEVLKWRHGRCLVDFELRGKGADEPERVESIVLGCSWPRRQQAEAALRAWVTAAGQSPPAPASDAAAAGKQPLYRQERWHGEKHDVWAELKVFESPQGWMSAVILHWNIPAYVTQR